MADALRGDDDDDLYAVSIANGPDVEDLDEEHAGARSIRSEHSDDDDDAGSILTTTSISDGASLLRIQSFAFNLSGSAHTTSEASSREAQASKAIEAAQGALATPSLRSRAPSLAPSSIWPSYEPERRPLLDGGPAPPDYSQATAWRSSNAARAARPFSPSPSFMSTASGKKRNWKRAIRRRWMSFCLLHVLVYCAIITGILIAWLVVQIKARKAFGGRVFSDVTAFDYMSRLHVSNAQCRFSGFNDFEVFEWRTAPANFSVIESLRPQAESVDADVRITGRLEILRASLQRDRDMPIKAVVSSATGGYWPYGEPVFEQSPTGLQVKAMLPEPEIRLPHVYSPVLTSQRLNPVSCLDVLITITIREPVENLRIHTDHLDVEIAWEYFSNMLYDLHFGMDGYPATNRTDITTERGNVAVNHLMSHDVSIATGSGAVAGLFSLENELRLSSQSGDINAEIFVDAGSTSDEGSRLAQLHTRTIEGDQKLSIQPLWIQSQSPPLGGELAQPQGTVATDSKYLPLLNSEHYSESGAISVNAGSWWEGTADVRSAIGEFDLIGSNLMPLNWSEGEVHTEGLLQPYRARRGTRQNVMTVRSHTGKVHVDLDGANQPLGDVP